ncbi:MAG: hypothetical protein H8E15_10885 [Planctomycetes bacterium]|nr:hypothetical protein [Planctomycetota bacterium]
MSALSLPIVAILGAIAAIALAAFAAFHLLGIVFWIVGGAIVFAFQSVRDAFQLVVGIFRVFFNVPRIVLAIILGRWSAARHYGDALETALLRCVRLIYQLFIGNFWEVFISRPMKARKESPKVESYASATRKKAQAAYQAKRAELRKDKDNLKNANQPKIAAMAKAKPSLHTPGPDKPKRGQGFDGYKVVGSLPSGGSGAKLYVANPSDDKRAALSRNSKDVAAQVVIKCFTLDEGSNLSQIVRESRALESAKQMGMVYEHGLDERRYFYVMPYVAGENLSKVSERMHALAGPKGLSSKQIKQALSYVGDLLVSLQSFHNGGLWHKDIKPDNVVIRNGRAHLVDLGLVTPLTSAMTLTTHGTEYFRDPELVRQALKGAKVQDVDGARFDLYGAGAVLFSLIEDSFPAHGSLSSVTKQCPNTVQWVIRRAMADLNSRYLDAGQMLRDVRTIQAAADPFELKPADLPSMGGFAVEPDVMTPPPVPDFATPVEPQPIPASEIPVVYVPGPTYQPGPMTAAYAEKSVDNMPPPVPGSARMHALNAAHQARMAARSARRAAREARRKAQVHFSARKQAITEKRVQVKESLRKQRKFAANPNRGVVIGLSLAILMGVAFAGAYSIQEQRSGHRYAQITSQVRAAKAAAANARENGNRVHAPIAMQQVEMPQQTMPQITYSGNQVVITHDIETPTKTAWLLPNFRAVHREIGSSRSSEDLNNAIDSGSGKELARERGNGYILMLDELSRHNPEDAEHMNGLIQHLQQSNYGVLGVFDQELHESSEWEVEISAQARRSLGLYGPSDEASRRQIKDFLSKHPSVDAVLWCGKVGDNLTDSAYLFSQADFEDDEIFKLLQGGE